ncbi:MAG: EF-hand domain-containing protein [Sphingobium sp.]|nr:EF-hand domain-containing protein [Sphingobium sp.]MBP6111475.1 EF-hand domain-containing protein [Sphingobium sp.]MBP8670113.1 EF-hand domain-containing protein [Sphingobium sp.]MBP9157382.1 EF-hand domain-containing protein [Sphingobium sp.]MCC6481929.1 EF-hand domain-containing protein [Sphingomonadaceae bacterium]
MIRIVLAGLALAAPVSLIAQDASQQGMGTGSASSSAQTPQGTTTQGTSMQGGTSTASPSSSSAGVTAATGAQVAAVVDQEFPAYDADKSGVLDKTEFSKWILDLKAKEMQASGKTASQTELSAWATAAFTTADADQNKNVSRTELTKYLGG